MRRDKSCKVFFFFLQYKDGGKVPSKYLALSDDDDIISRSLLMENTDVANEYRICDFPELAVYKDLFSTLFWTSCE